MITLEANVHQIILRDKDTHFKEQNPLCGRDVKLSVFSDCCNYTTSFDSHANGKNNKNIISRGFMLFKFFSNIYQDSV